MLKLILAVSADDFLARGPEDDMSWTGQDDKTAFRLLTSVGGVCGVGYRSWLQMPPSLRGRQLIPITQDGRLVSHPSFAEEPPTFWTQRPLSSSTKLGRFVYCNPHGWLLGGPTLAMDALQSNIVDQVYLCRSSVRLGEGLADLVSPWLQSRGEIQNAGTPWRVEQRIHVGETRVDVWRRLNHGKRPEPRD